MDGKLDNSLELEGTELLKTRGFDRNGRSIKEKANTGPDMINRAMRLTTQRLAALRPVAGAGGSVRVTKRGRIVSTMATCGAVPQCVNGNWQPRNLAADADDNTLTDIEHALDE